MKEEIIKGLEKYRLIPVIKLNTPEEARPMAEALAKGGLPVAEVTFRTDAAEESLKIISKDYSNILLGAGTVTNIAQARRAINAGAQFIVGPGFSESVAETCYKESTLYIPGVCTPTEIIKALDYGIDVVKFFPSEACGGLDMIKAMAAVFPNVRFIPTGGINASNVTDYLRYDKIVACGGTWMVDNKLVSKGEFDEIEKLISEAVDLVRK